MVRGECRAGDVVDADEYALHVGEQFMISAASAGTGGVPSPTRIVKAISEALRIHSAPTIMKTAASTTDLTDSAPPLVSACTEPLRQRIWDDCCGGCSPRLVGIPVCSGTLPSEGMDAPVGEEHCEYW